MNNAKEKVVTLLSQLPEDCTLEDVQYHLYVLEKVQKGLSRAENEGTISQEEVENKFKKWLS